MAPKMTQEGATKGDAHAEDELLKMCAETAAESFQKVAQAL